ncbi:hypothetical protein U1Q18_022069 [Sarracenia purpurea var. burkii]
MVFERLGGDHFTKNSIVVRKWLSECNEDDDVGGVRRKSALDEVVKYESAAGVDAVLDEHDSAAPSCRRVGATAIETYGLIKQVRSSVHGLRPLGFRVFGREQTNRFNSPWESLVSVVWRHRFKRL